MHRIPQTLALLAAVVLFAVACGDDVNDAGSDDRPTVVVTTNILGDVVANLAGGAVEIVTIMPVGADPHDFQASAREVDAMRSADALVVNGGGFEKGLIDVIEGAEADGVAVFEAMSAVSTIEYGDDDHDDHEDHEDHEDHDGDEDHDDHDDHDGDEDHDDHDGHDHDGADPHFFTDPARMAVAAHAIADFLIAEVDGIDADAVAAAVEAYESELEALDAEVADLVSSIPAESRVLVTNHEVFGYFADRYDFDVIGTVIPGGSTTDGASAGALAKLAETLQAEGVTVIFADTSASDELAQTLAAEVGDIEVVTLYSESLGEPGSDGATYVDMIRANAKRIAAALAS